MNGSYPAPPEPLWKTDPDAWERHKQEMHERYPDYPHDMMREWDAFLRRMDGPIPKKNVEG